MAAVEHRPGSIFWIDHFVVPVNDLYKAAVHLMGGIPLDRDFVHYDLGWSDTKLLQVEIDIPRPAA